MCWRELDGLIKSLKSKLTSGQHSPSNYASLTLGRKIHCLYELSDQEIRLVQYRLCGSSGTTQRRGGEAWQKRKDQQNLAPL